MKRFAAVIAIALLITVFSGCSTPNGGLKSDAPPATATPIASDTPPPATPEPSLLPAETPEPDTTPEETTPEPRESAPANTIYTSTNLGITFTIPQSWAGKYRVEEADGCLTVYFNPAEPLGRNSWSGELFSVCKEASGKRVYLSGEWTFELNGTSYVWGIIDSMSYSEFAPEYDTYTAMEKDIPAIFDTVQSLSGSAPKNVRRLWLEVIPQTAEYTTTMGLGIRFTLPESWIGKCRIVERADFVSFFFNPQVPFNANMGDGYLFSILKKTSDSDADFMDSVLEFEVNGVTYISGTSTDVSYSADQPEYDTYLAMCADRQEILDSVRGA
jgi:hypothetical protein